MEPGPALGLPDSRTAFPTTTVAALALGRQRISVSLSPLLKFTILIQEKDLHMQKKSQERHSWNVIDRNWQLIAMGLGRRKAVFTGVLGRSLWKRQALSYALKDQ